MQKQSDLEINLMRLYPQMLQAIKIINKPIKMPKSKPKGLISSKSKESSLLISWPVDKEKLGHMSKSKTFINLAKRLSSI